MIILAFTVEFSGAEGRSHARVIPTFVGDTPDERDALVRFAAEMGQPNNSVRTEVLRLCKEKGIKGTE